MTELLPISFNFVLAEAGWAALTVCLGEKTVVIDRISYLTSALDDLLIAGLHLSFGYGDETVTFDNEGWLTHVKFERVWVDRPDPVDGIYADDRIRISVVDDDNGKVVELLTGLCENNDRVARALLAMGEKVWNDLGPEEYDRRWISTGFPNRALAALRTALSEAPCPGYIDDKI